MSYSHNHIWTPLRGVTIIYAILCCAVLSACGSKPPQLPPPLATPTELISRGKASVVFAAEISTPVRSPECLSGFAMLVSLKDAMPISAIPSTLVAGKTYSIFFIELDAGAYALKEVYCKGLGHNSPSYKFSTRSTPFVTFEVRAGEVVDLGTLHINMFDKDATFFAEGKGPSPIVLVSSAPDHSRALALPESLRANAVLRMAKSHFPADQTALSKACEDQRLYRSTHAAIASIMSIMTLNLDAPICKFVTKP